MICTFPSLLIPKLQKPAHVTPPAVGTLLPSTLGTSQGTAAAPHRPAPATPLAGDLEQYFNSWPPPNRDR